MLRLSRNISKSELHIRACVVRLSAGQYSSTTEKSPSEAAAQPPPPKKKGGVFWKLVGLTLAGAGGVVGYAWYDSNFKKTVEDNVPYSRDAFEYLFQFLPPWQQLPDLKIPSSEKKTSPAVQHTEDVKIKELPPAKPAAEPAAATESKKEIAEREAREKKEKAQQLLRDREAQEAAENIALETGLESLQRIVFQAVESAAAGNRAAAKAIRLHTEQLKKAMEEGSTEASWEALIDNQQSRADLVWSSEQSSTSARESLEKLRKVVADGRANVTTKRNKALSAAEKEINRFEKELSSAVAELSKARSEAKKLSDYRDLVRSGKEQFKKELEELGTVTRGETSTELNSLIAYAHRRIGQLQKQLAEQQALESLRIESALAAASDNDEKKTEFKVTEERLKAAAELEKHLASWEAEARVEYEAELRKQLARQTAAHSDHLVEALRSQRAQLIAEFEKELNERVAVEKYRLQAGVADSLARMKAIEKAVEGRAEKERIGYRARELWLACRTLLSTIKEGRPSTPSVDKPIRICAELGAIRKAGSEHPIVHVALDTVPDLVHSRGIYTSDALAQRFARVRQVARRVAMIDETGGSPARYVLSYIQSFFVLRTKPIRQEVANISELSTFALLDSAEDCLRRGEFEQAVRFVNGLRGESRRVASSWLEDARVLLETRQAAELLLAFAAASGLDSTD